MNRRGQLALFVLIGIVLLLVVLLYLFRAKIFGGADLDPTLAGQEQLAPVRDLVITCTSSSLEKLLREIGANGGYLDTSTLRHSPIPQDSDTVSFAPQDVAYWSHLRRCSQNPAGCEASEQPPLCKPSTPCPIRISVPGTAMSIQEQLELALPADIEACLGDFSRVSEDFDVKATGKAQAAVLFTNSAVAATIEWPLKITDKATGKSTTLREFQGRADVNLVRIYKLAHALAQAERDTSFLERLTLHLISVYSGVDSALPPMRAVTIMGPKKYWSRTQVEQLLQEEVLPWADFIQMPNALGSFVPIWPSATEMAGLSEEEQKMYAGIYYYLYVKPVNETYPDIKARFFYPGTKPYLSINGGQELLKPRSADTGGMLQKMVGIFLNDYRFRYDLSYPVIVTYTDTSAFGKKGYDWSFALEANIQKNAPVDRSGASQSFIVTNDRVDLTAPQQRVRNTIRITTKDRATGEPLPFTRVSYRCGDDFFIGETDENAQLTTRFPYCRFGGVILYSKEGYLGSGSEYDNYLEGITKEFSLALWPTKNVTLTMRKRTVEDVTALSATTPTYDTIRTASHALNDSDVVILNFARVKETPYDEDIPLVGIYTFSPKNQTFQADLAAKRREVEQLEAQGILTKQDVQEYIDAINESVNTSLTKRQPSVTVPLVPGAYTVDAFLLHNDVLTIPSETREFCIAGGGSTCIGKKTFTLNATNFTMWLSGSALLNASEPFELTDNVLYRYDTYSLYVLEQRLPTSWGDLENVAAPDEYTKGKRMLLLPTYE